MLNYPKRTSQRHCSTTRKSQLALLIYPRFLHRLQGSLHLDQRGACLISNLINGARM